MARTVPEVEQSEIATLVVESNLTDTNESARAAATVGAHARQVVTIEQSIDQMALAFGLGGSGTNLRDRCAQIPGFVVDIGSSPASGAVLALVRDDSSGELTVPSGGSVQTAAGVVYVTASDLVFLDGELNYPATGQNYGVVIATVPGTAGNCDAGAIVTARSMPAGVISVTNPVALTNGLNAETDAQLRKRALDYISGGISQQTPAGLRALALQFRASDGTRCRHAVVSQDPTRPYSTLIVDDGNGFVGFTRAAVQTGGTVPDGGQLSFWFESPQSNSSFVLKVNGVAVGDVQWTAIQERGIAYLDDSAAFWSAGDTWTVDSFQVYFGFLAELQRVIEGALAYQGISVGYRSTGTRVRVMAPFVESVEFDALVTYASGFDPDQVNVAFRSAIVQFLIALAPGSPLLVAHLIARLDRVPGVLNHSLRNPGDTALAMPDRWPANLETRLSTSVSQIKINGVV